MEGVTTMQTIIWKKAVTSGNKPFEVVNKLEKKEDFGLHIRNELIYIEERISNISDIASYNPREGTASLYFDRFSTEQPI